MDDKIQKQLRQLRTLSQELGWGELMMHVGSLMAEQADKTDGAQSTALFGCANTIHALREPWHQCGRFTYPADMVDLS